MSINIIKLTTMSMWDTRFLQDELRSTALQRQKSASQMLEYTNNRTADMKDFHKELKAKVAQGQESSWAATYLQDNSHGSMRHVLDELKKEKKKKRRSKSVVVGPVNDEFMKLQEELKQRTKNRNVDKLSLYAADGGVDGDGKARLEITKKDILDEIRKKSANRRSSGSKPENDYGLLGSTKSNVLDELKKRSKRKKRNSSSRIGDSRRPSAGSRSNRSEEASHALSTSSRSHRSDEDKRHRFAADSEIEDVEGRLSPFSYEKQERNMPGSRSPVPTNLGVETDVHYQGLLRNVPMERTNARGSSDDETDSNDKSENLEEAYDEGSRDVAVKKIRSPFDEFYGEVSPVPKAKESLHSELKKHFKAPSRSRSLMYKYGNYADERRASLHEELQTRVPRVAPRAYSRSTSLVSDRSNVHDELKSRYGESTYSSRLLSVRAMGSNDFKDSQRSSLNDNIRDRMRIDDRLRRPYSRGSSMGRHYNPGTTGTTTRSFDEVDDVADERDSDHGKSFFIPGITGTARCLNSADRTSRDRRTSALSTLSGGSEDSSAGASGDAMNQSIGRRGSRSSETRPRISTRSDPVATANVELEDILWGTRSVKTSYAIPKKY